MEKVKTMNMEEKKKLEKLALEDISKVANALSSKKYTEMQELQAKLVQKPSHKAKDLLEAYTKSVKASEKIEEDLLKEGFKISRNGSNKENPFSLYLNNYQKHSEVLKLEESYKAKEDKIVAMRREVVVGLYTTGIEARKFLEDLNNKLEALLK